MVLEGKLVGLGGLEPPTSPFDLDVYLLYYTHSITIFEHQLDPKKIARKEPLEDIPDRYENI